MRVLIADKLSAHVAAALEASGCAVTTEPSLKGDSLTAALDRVDPQVLVVRSTKVRAEQLAAARSLSLIIRAGAGTNTIDVGRASARGVYVANCPGKNAIAVAELTFGHLLNLDRRISDNVEALRDGRWAKKEFSKARGVHGRTLALLGCGRIGQEVIARAHAFGMSVRAWSRSLTPERAAALGVAFAATPHEACRGADVLSVHLALTDDTRGLVDRSLLEALTPGAFVINTSRGGVVDQDALLLAVETRGIKAGLDVFAQEPGAGDDTFSFPIGQERAVYGTHHIGASTEQATLAVGDEVVRIVDTYLSQGTVINCVNLAEDTAASHLLVVRHADEVGVLASVLGHLRQDGVNVQEMDNHIFKGGGAACARIHISGAPSAAAIDRIGGDAQVFAASLVSLES
jgi:D-3-phosphoglycerate dehydrogenase / 2-oxoglutarate reductase